MTEAPLPPISPFTATRKSSFQRKDAPVDQKLLARKHSISQHSIMAVRARLNDEDQLEASNEMINQFLRATGGDQEHVRHCPAASC